MVGGDGFIQAYNAQLAVDEGHQVIVASGVTNQPADNAHLVPMLKRMKANLGAVAKYTTGDSGYWHPEVESEARELGTRPWWLPGGCAMGSRGRRAPRASPPRGWSRARRMRWRLNSAEGRSVYARRKAVVEPVNGQIKHARGFVSSLSVVATQWKQNGSW